LKTHAPSIAKDRLHKQAVPTRLDAYCRLNGLILHFSDNDYRIYCR
jgi:hypothetical protein